MLKNKLNFVSKSKGFTLVELIFVIIILAILASFAVPRFASLQVDSRQVIVKSAAGSVKAAASLAHAKSLASDAGANTAITMDGVSIDMVNWWPAATSSGIGAALQDTTNLTVDEDAGASPPTFTISADGASGICETVYTQSASAGVEPTYSTSVTDAGCV